MPGVVTFDTDRMFAPLLGRRGIGLAVSGGADSLALMLLVAEWASHHPTPPIFVYSVDHGLRPEAADEARMVATEATRLGFAARALRWDGEKPDTGVQAAARAARYRLMAAAMAADGADILLTAHHLNDQAETVLMRLAHGSGIEGLRGMDRLGFAEGCLLFRPLLDVDPADLRAIVDRAGLIPADDPSNRDSDYERVRWRQELPQLAALGLDGRRLATFALRMNELDDLVTIDTDTAQVRLLRLPSASEAALPHADFSALPRPVAVRLIGRVLGTIGGDRKPHALGALETLCDRLGPVAALKRTSLHGCLIASDGTTITIRRETGRRGAAVMPEATEAVGDNVTRN
ncbi:tRNA lysidine(34) synthetase TilS [Devosia sp.]|uniref:tRNA lysidine(34) synthetase TilS n=1 Tax=Devosia sp. TaxID=1871048 RepID=UPI003BAAAEBA